MTLVLLGYRGSGKTTIGRRLADRLWGTFVDTDEQIVRAAGRDIATLFADQGENAFRDLESVALAESLALAPTVLATGGGVVLREQNRRTLIERASRRVYLRCDADVLSARLVADASANGVRRPSLTDLCLDDEVRRLSAEREPLYREVMTHELDVSHLTPDEAVDYLSRMM